MELETKVIQTQEKIDQENTDLKKIETKIITNEEILYGKPSESRLAELESRIPEKQEEAKE